jgi:Leucine-rich repeat (LRR) protein
MLTLFETYKLILESKATEQQSLKILNDAEIPDADQVLEKLKAIDESNNQKNLPFMATIFIWSRNRYNIINNMKPVFKKYEELLKNNKIKPMQLIQNQIVIGDKPYNNFLEMSEYIDAEYDEYEYKQKRKNEVYQKYENEDVPLLSSNGIDVYDGNEVGKCIKYTQGLLTGRSYSFCIGQPANSMYHSYRSDKASTFYFIVDRNKFKTNSDGSVNLDDPLHIVVYDVTMYGIELTDADNRTGNISEYGKDVQGYISYLKSNGINVDKLKNKEFTPEEEEEEELIGETNDSLEWFMKLRYEMKSKYIGRGHRLTDEQFNSILSKKDLIKQYVNTGISIPYYQYKKIAQIPSLFTSYMRARNTATQNGDDLEYYEMNDEQLEELGEIKMEVLKITEFPDFIYKAKNITYLNLRTTNIVEIPTDIEKLQNLKTFNLTRSQVKILPETIGNLKNLNYLNLGYNKITTLPESIGDLNNLKEIYIDHNELTTLPESFGNLQNLEKIYLVSNQLTTLPKNFRNLQNLRSLILEGNQFTTLPDAIIYLQNLDFLQLLRNQITTLPESFGNLQNLDTLNLEYNQLTTLPESFGNLKKLRSLYLRKNQLTTLPESFGNLENLEVLYLEYNQLTTFPESIKNLKKLRYLDILGNNFSNEYINKLKTEILPNCKIEYVPIAWRNSDK